MLTWDADTFRKKFFIDYESKGNKFIADLRHNNMEIYQKITTDYFASIIPFAIDISCISRFYDATNLALVAEELTEHLDGYKVFDHGVIKMRNEFDQVQQKKAVQLFIAVLKATNEVINTWEQFRNTGAAQNYYESEIVGAQVWIRNIIEMQNLCGMSNFMFTYLIIDYNNFKKSMVCIFSQFQPKSKASRPASCRSRKSEIDESLFGNTNKRQDLKTAKIISSVRRGDTSNPDLILIGEGELLRMKNNAIVTTKEEQLYQKKLVEEQKEKQMAAAKAKKQRMIALEDEKKKFVPLSAQQQEDKVVKDSLIARAAEILNEQLDDVKEMNKMVMYAKCVTIRDKQLNEKQQLKEEFKSQEKRKDLMMEIERLKSVKYYEEKDVVHKEELKKGHDIIVEQIKERELIRLKDKEEQERDGQVMLKQIKQLQIEESQKGMQKKQQQKKLQDEILEANGRAIVVKEKRIKEEKEEEEKIVKYNLEKAQKEAEYLEEQKRIKEEKEREVQRLREMQEKAQDRQAELDQLRAKRAMEQNERAAREKERREAELRMKLNSELQNARKLQQSEKQERLEEQARLERDEFQRVIQKQKQERDNEVRLQQEKETLVKKHADELRKQISMNEEKRKQEERDKLEEGKKIRDKMLNEKKMLESIKQQKLHALNDNSIPDKYKAELAKKKINIQV